MSIVNAPRHGGGEEPFVEMHTVWCPTCDTPQDVPMEDNLDMHGCTECGQTLGGGLPLKKPEMSCAEEYEALTKGMEYIYDIAERD